MEAKQHILAIRLSAMGDVAMLVPVIIALTKKYSNLHLHILTKEMYSVFFEDIPDVEVHIADTRGKHKSLPGILRLAAEIPNRIDVIADVHNVLRSKILRRVLSMRGLKNEQIRKGRRDKKALTRTQNKVFKPLKTSHQRYAEVFEKLGYPVELKPEHVKPKKAISQSVVEALNIDKNEKLIGFAPFAAHRSKRLPLAKTKWILQELNEKLPDYKIVLFGGGDKETADLNELENELPNAINAAGKFLFKEELSLISNLKLMLSMDSGNGHLAAMYGVPVLTFWGGTHPFAGFAPFLQPKENQFLPDLEKYPLLPMSIYGNKMIEGYENVMDSIDYNAAIKRIVELAN
ncbi:glycosyltransferase family 9 protein [Psychroflexus planctonicus]|uniref:Heptosyltransferase n=1 Tax=Psychroflexus planctonicus TaxID=1526575 RepID=A0ABQ1SK93_9FLAO|nr:glycosyltransferase family 9 protein [Psychroflexus planctonicus]GGE40745.1 heptosyltransferase [Psychroflexus planctonicus]